jgi:molybdate transport system substrate-binding protein
VSYAASSTLARQIDAGAPAQVYLSADVAWMDYLDERGLIDPTSRVDVARNTLVLIAPDDSATTLRIAPEFDLAGALHDSYLAMGDPDHVPAGLYGKAALEHLGVWRAVVRRVARAADVRAALALVARGEARLGVVYGSDAVAEPRVRVVGVFPGDSHPDIVYPAAAVRGNASREARGFVRFLAGEGGAKLFARYGFLPVGG